ncbi:thioredoxin family protein [Alcaligenaceae bacterium A4P071]|nr:thioredoxin family protein [Alcaligenaceae bacterium A4P071]
MEEVELSDGDADRYLLDAKGLSLLVFHSRTCANCRIAREQLPEMSLQADRICWIDAGTNGGLVERYEVFHLPAMYLVRDGVFYGAVEATLADWDIRQKIRLQLDSYPAELP